MSQISSLLVKGLCLLTLVTLCSASVCTSQQPAIAAPYKNIWSGLTDDEAIAVIKLLLDRSSGLNLTAEEDAGSGDNTIINLDLLAPNKTDVLPFINNKGAAPPRYARATLVFGAASEPYLQDYTVGPLPVGSDTKAQPLQFLYNNKGGGKVDATALTVDTSGFLQDVALSVADITKRLWNATVNDTLGLTQASVPFKENGKLITWSGFANTPTSGFNSITLLPLGLWFGADLTSSDPSKWTVAGWYYDGQFYPTTRAFRAAAASPNFVKLAANTDGEWTHTGKQGAPLKFDNLPPPTPIPQGPQRFSVDFKENYVEWMDFSFYISFNGDTGMRLYDVRYKGQRILYELGLQEAIAHYAGNDPVQSGTIYFDSFYGIGGDVDSLADGFDCPTYSTYLNVTLRDGNTSYIQPNAICLFEFDQGYPIQRHSTAAYTSVSKNIAFTMRSISTVGNYDYMFQYTFFLDGSLEVSVRASGYIQSAYSANNEDYGFRIHDSLSGSMHDHVLNYKADFDILGEKNSLQKIDFVPATVEYPWSAGTKRNTMKIEKSFIENEDEGKLNWAPNNAAFYAVVNKDTPNKYGEYPGYRVTPATSNAIALTVVDSSNGGNAVNFVDHQFYVTKQKDTEARSASPYNQLDTVDPPVDFAKFFDGESLDQEDIVVWFNLGMHHLPHTGDLPNTVYTTAHSAISIQPQNYLLSDPSRETTQQVVIITPQKGPVQVKTYGAQNGTCQLDASELYPKLWRNTGVVAGDTLINGASTPLNNQTGMGPDGMGPN